MNRTNRAKFYLVTGEIELIGGRGVLYLAVELIYEEEAILSPEDRIAPTFAKIILVVYQWGGWSLRSAWRRRRSTISDC